MEKEREATVMQALSQLLWKHDASASISAIDEIVLSYVVSILEDLGSDEAAEDAFDVEGFCEMMGAYLPGFEDIDSVEICEWMFELATKLENKEVPNGQIQQLDRHLPANGRIPICDDLSEGLHRPNMQRESPFNHLSQTKTSINVQSIACNPERLAQPHINEQSKHGSPFSYDQLSQCKKPVSNGQVKHGNAFDFDRLTQSNIPASQPHDQIPLKIQVHKQCKATITGHAKQNKVATRQITSSNASSNSGSLGDVYRQERSTSTSSERSRTSDSSDGVQQGADDEINDVDDEQMVILSEMFPEVCRLEVSHCLVTAHGDVDTAVNLLLHRQETGEALQARKKQRKKSQHDSNAFLDDHKLKNNILQKYSYVALDEDSKSHKPALPKSGPQKLVRYLDSKIVNTKGQRFTEVKKSEDEDMKKTYVNLKPAKQYRFH